jgi:hypothetical protein
VLVPLPSRHHRRRPAPRTRRPRRHAVLHHVHYLTKLIDERAHNLTKTDTSICVVISTSVFMHTYRDILHTLLVFCTDKILNSRLKYVLTVALLTKKNRADQIPVLPLFNSSVSHPSPFPFSSPSLPHG